MTSVVMTSLVEVITTLLLLFLLDGAVVTEEEAALVVEAAADVWTELETADVWLLEALLEVDSTDEL